MKTIVVNLFQNIVALVVVLLLTQTLAFGVTVNSLEALLPYLDDDNVNVKLSPGTYAIDADDVDAGTFDNPIFLFEGSNSTYDFSGVSINFDTDLLQAFGSVSVHQIQITGNNNVLKNLTMVDVGSVYDRPRKGATNLVMDGSGNRVEGFHMTVKGSHPYGYGDAFGKGASYTIKHYKHCGLLVRGESNHVLNCIMIHRAYGHGIFMQAASNPTIEGCYVEGEVRTTDDMLAEQGTGSAADDIDFMTDWGYRLPAGYMMSLQEAGIRAYNAGTTVINGKTYERGTSNPTILNNTIKNMRTGVTLAHASGTKYVSGTKILGCEQGFSIGSGTIVDCSADAIYGPVYRGTYSSDKNITADIMVLPGSGYYNGTSAIAYIGGSNHDLTFTGTESSVNQNLKIMVTGDYKGIRVLNDNNASQNNFTSSNVEINNLTNYPLILESESSGTEGESCGKITDRGSGNDVQKIDCDIDDDDGDDDDDGSNLALSGTATQSSTDYSGAAARAIDGNTSGVWNDGSITHTANEAQAWWQVDLGASYAIEEIQVYGRTDNCCRPRLSDYDVIILDSNGNQVWSTYEAGYPDPMVSLNPGGAGGRVVMVQLRGTEYLSLAEVKVFGTPSDDNATADTLIGFTLINADSDQEIMALTDGARIDLSDLDIANLNIQADADAASALSYVRLGLTGDVSLTRTESVAPYALWGDKNGNFYPGQLSSGDYTLVATPVVDGVAGQALSISFEVVE